MVKNVKSAGLFAARYFINVVNRCFFEQNLGTRNKISRLFKWKMDKNYVTFIRLE